MTIYDFTLRYIIVVVKACNKSGLVHLVTYCDNIFGYLVTTSVIPQTPCFIMKYVAYNI